MIQVLIAESRMEHREHLRAMLARDPELEVAGQARDGFEVVRLAHAIRPDVVLVAARLPGRDGFEIAELLAASGLPLETILLADNVSSEELHQALRAGAREILGMPLLPEQLCAAVHSVSADGKRRRSPDFVASSGHSQGASVVAVTGAKGGIGKTTLAVNLAVALATQTQEPTVLLDLYTQFGDAALLLNLTPRRTLADLIALDPADLDERLLEDHLERHHSGLRVLAGASAPLPPEALTVAYLERLLVLLGHGHRFIVLDVPPLLSAATRYALSHASHTLLIANLFDLTTLADSRLWLEAVSGEFATRDAVQVVLNRVSARNHLAQADIEQTLGCPVSALIPNDGKIVPNSVNSGVPFVLSHPSSRIAQSVCALAQTLVARGNSSAASVIPNTTPTRSLSFWTPLARKGG